MNKQTIADIEKAEERWHAKLNLAVRKLNELRQKKKKIRAGKLRQPAPPGVRVKLKPASNTITHDEFGDLVPSFGPR